MKENTFTLKKARNIRYPAQTITDADYADIALLANTPTQAEYLQQSLEQATGSIDLDMNTDKTDYNCFNEEVDISTLNGGSLKLVDEFTYLGGSVSSTESDIKMRLANAWTAVDKFLIIWKSNQSDQIKFLPSSSCANFVAFEKGNFTSPSTTVGNFSDIYIYMYIYILW